jgi:hypothetical protein
MFAPLVTRERATYSWPWEKTGDRLLLRHLDLHLEVFVPKKKKEIAASGGWGVTEYLQLDWMDEGMDGWKKLHDVLYYM